MLTYLYRWFFLISNNGITLRRRRSQSTASCWTLTQGNNFAAWARCKSKGKSEKIAMRRLTPWMGSNDERRLQTWQYAWPGSQIGQAISPGNPWARQHSFTSLYDRGQTSSQAGIRVTASTPCDDKTSMTAMVTRKMAEVILLNMLREETKNLRMAS